MAVVPYGFDFSQTDESYPKKRGRKAKVIDIMDAPKVTKKRGRKPKNETSDIVSEIEALAGGKKAKTKSEKKSKNDPIQQIDQALHGKTKASADPTVKARKKRKKKDPCSPKKKAGNLTLGSKSVGVASKIDNVVARSERELSREIKKIPTKLKSQKGGKKRKKKSQ